jgi:hypothetical protein
MLLQLPNSVTDISYSGQALIDELQDRINEGSDRLQLKVYWSHPHSDNDSIADGLRFLQSSIKLFIHYRE